MYCDMSVVGGEGWTVIQRRIDGAEDFDKNWKQYKTGFGDFNGNFWLGLEKIHRLTESGSFELYIAVKYHDTEQSGAVKWAKYDSFSIANEANDYKLTVGSYDGTSTAGDALDLVSINLKHVPTAILGLTVLAIGNSVGDWVADTAVARAGQPGMGVASCFGSPLLNDVLGLSHNNKKREKKVIVHFPCISLRSPTKISSRTHSNIQNNGRPTLFFTLHKT